MTAILALVASVAVLLSFITAVIGLLNQRKIKHAASSVQEVHVLVNAQLSKVLARVDQLSALLTKHDIPVPPDGEGKTE
jgi:hypothetical protein